MFRTFRAGILLGFGLGLGICLFVIFLFAGNQNSLALDTLSRIQKDLSKYHLFLLQPAGEKKIFQGRWLNLYRFAVDADNPTPALWVWIDDSDHLAGITALWDGNHWGTPADSNDNDHFDFFCNNAVCDSLERLTGIDLSVLLGENKPESKNGKDTWKIEYKSWKIAINRDAALSFMQPSKSHISLCMLNKATYDPNSKEVDCNIYPFFAVGVNW
jgi:hypothetical protein